MKNNSKTLTQVTCFEVYLFFFSSGRNSMRR